jgi:hypothetical protein
MNIDSNFSISNDTVNFDSADFDTADFSQDFSLDDSVSVDTTVEAPQIEANSFDTTQINAAEFSGESLNISEVNTFETASPVTPFPGDDQTLNAGIGNFFKNLGAENGNFTTEQSAEVDSAISAGKDLIDRRQAELGRWNQNDQANFERCFGTTDLTSKSAVQEVLNNTENTLSNWTAEENGRFMFMEPGDVAGVDPNNSSNFEVSERFFELPRGGIDSANASMTQAGALVHEGTHLNENGASLFGTGTDDIQYGIEGVQQLAQDNPGAALRNADTYRLYVENACVAPQNTGE